MHTLVVGAGAMGRWVGRVIDADLDGAVTFSDRDTGVAEEAAAAVGGQVADPGGPDDTYDLVCIAVPMPATPAAIRSHGPRGRAVVDLAGVMGPPVAAMAELSTPEAASLHPLFAPAAEPGNVPAVVERCGPTVEGLLTTLRRRDNTVFETTAAEHDRAMETVQARTHAAVLAFALAADPVPDRFQTPVSAALAELADRVTDGDPRVYADIQAAFDGADDVATAARRVADADSEAFERLYRAAGDTDSETDHNC